jgi:RNA polymerase sigma-70 factor (ECF subfamily)
VGHKPDFERFYEAEARAVFSAVYSLCRDRELAEDATQEGFARALERWDRLGSEPWVMTTALNLARRSLRRRPSLTTTAHHPSQEEDVDLWAKVRALPRRQQEVVVLYYLLQMPAEEIARILRVREGTVRTHLVRARQALRTALGEDADGD